jgi:mannan endo-1,4-beta-mannosidase
VCVQFIWSSYSGSIVFEEALPFKYSGKMKSLSVNSGVYLQAWIEEMAAYVKSLDMKHLVTVGIEGFYGPGRSERLGVNPGDWAASLCSDFIQNSAVKDIDFASVHAYPDTWSV